MSEEIVSSKEFKIRELERRVDELETEVVRLAGIISNTRGFLDLAVKLINLDVAKRAAVLKKVLDGDVELPRLLADHAIIEEVS